MQSYNIYVFSGSILNLNLNLFFIQNFVPNKKLFFLNKKKKYFSKIHGILLFRFNRNVEAEYSFEQCLFLCKDISCNANVLNAHAISLKKYSMQNAEDLLRRALDIVPTHIDTMHNLATLLHEKGELYVFMMQQFYIKM